MLQVLERKIDEVNTLSLDSRLTRGAVALILALAVFLVS